MTTTAPRGSAAPSDDGRADRTDLRELDAWWRAANHLAVGQIYLMDNPLLRAPLSPEHTSSRGCSGTGAPPRA